MGGTDHPDNLIELSVEEHAEAHRMLFEKYGHWQDYVAWQGLAKLMSKEEIVADILSHAGKKGIRSRATNVGKSYDTTRIVEAGIRKGAKNPCARHYIVDYPDGSSHQVVSLKTWCEAKGLNYNTFHTMCVRKGKEHRGYRARKAD